ncbi:hypothetical protein LCGC14_1886760 [marine sediment metagenome]|uniref:Uncharacterized protein n=1 Tax=marine sediment metagenome TaxID=412755 RepID=A0A0F9IYY2_9ZZZZ
MPSLNTQDAANARRQLRRRRTQAFLFVVPLLVFILFAFVAPITTMLFRSVYNPTVAELVPETLEMLEDWEGETLPEPAVVTQMAIDMKRMANNRTSGKFADEINRALPGMSSVIKSTARGLRRVDDAELAANGAEMLLAENDRWAKPATWRAIRSAGSPPGITLKIRNVITEIANSTATMVTSRLTVKRNISAASPSPAGRARHGDRHRRCSATARSPQSRCRELSPDAAP